MRRLVKRREQLSVWILSGIAFLWIWLAVMQLRSDWVFRAEGFSSASGRMALYVDRGGGFSEYEVYQAGLRGGRFEVGFRFPRGGVRALRWDGLDRTGAFQVDTVTWVTPGRFRAESHGLEEAVELNGVEVDPDAGSVVFLHRDGWLRFAVDPIGDLRFGMLAALPSIPPAAFLAGFGFLWNRRIRRMRQTPLGKAEAA